MAKLMGNLQITAHPATEAEKAHFEVLFVPYAGRLNTKKVRIQIHDDLVAFLMDLKLSEDESAKWAGRARAQGVVLISSFERADSLLKEMGLLA